MPLSDPVERELLHQRDIQVRGFLRVDQLIDIEATLTDVKSEGFHSQGRGWIAPGEPLHLMRVRMTIDQQMVIQACEAVTERSPFPICPGGAASMGLLAGLSIKPGFLKAANQRLGGTTGCTHLRELLQQMATVAFQTMWPVRSRRERAAVAAQAANALQNAPEGATAVTRADDGSARMLNSCYAYASSSPVVAHRWPHLYTGPDAEHPRVDQLADATSVRD